MVEDDDCEWPNIVDDKPYEFAREFEIEKSDDKQREKERVKSSRDSREMASGPWLRGNL